MKGRDQSEGDGDGVGKGLKKGARERKEEKITIAMRRAERIGKKKRKE